LQQAQEVIDHLYDKPLPHSQGLQTKLSMKAKENSEIDETLMLLGLDVF